ncbi:MAG: hypothetical protein IKO36_04835 [Bacteroidaceae bacterium]|nr:hypothetical protein [Bacteroidaceae bacterium]
MKKTIKPFDLEAAKKGAKVETRNGDKAEILKWDANSNCPLIGFYVDCEGHDNIGSWTLSGKWGVNTSSFDLVIVEYEDKEAPELGGIRAEPELATGFQHETKANSDDYSIELIDCDNGIFCHVHNSNPTVEDMYLVYKHEEQEQMFGKLLLDSVRDKMNADLCNKVRIEMKIFSETK